MNRLTARGLRPPALPVRPPRAPWPRSPPRCPVGWSTSRSAPRATRRPPRWSPRSPRRTASGLPAEHRHARAPVGASQRWLDRRFGVDVPIAQIAACVGTKEFVGTLPAVAPAAIARSRHRPLPGGRRTRPTRWAPSSPAAGRCAVPTDAAVPAAPRRHRPGRCRPGPRALGEQPGQPDRRARRPRRGRGVGPGARRARLQRRVLRASSPGTDRRAPSSSTGSTGVVAVHSLSKRSNLAGLRVGFYAGDAELVAYLQEVRKHVGMLVPGPAQAAGVVALDDDAHVEEQRQRYRRRLELMAGALSQLGRHRHRPAGRRLLPLVSDAGDGWDFTERRRGEGGRASSARASSTGPRVPTTSVSPWYNLSTVSTSSSSA